MGKLYIFAFSILGFQTIAQTTITGVVRSASDHHLLAGATVQVVGKEVGTVTNHEGAFALENISFDSLVLLIKFLGYDHKYDTINRLTPNLKLEILLVEKAILTDEVLIRATRASNNSATTFVNVDKATIQTHNFGRDLPLILNWTPSLVTTSDAGTGIGYTSLRIRGVDASHINVTINGIPYNDSESQATYWVNIPDVASSSEGIQIQRGVGTSSNGAGAFGATINLQTNSLISNPYSKIILSGGSFSTKRYSILAGTGLINKHWTFDAKVSKILSDGYVDRASSDLTSYYFSGGYYKKNTLLKVIAFGGHEKTYQSWGGIDTETLATNRTMNFLGAIYDSLGGINRYYDNQVDNYKQNHLQIHASQQLNSMWNANIALHYTRGSGYYEEYHQSRKFQELGLPLVEVNNDTIESSDLIVRKWLDNHFYGITWSTNYDNLKTGLIIGGAYNQYRPAKHYGTIIWGQNLGDNIPLGYRYYTGQSEKNDFNIYTKWNNKLFDDFNIFLDVQYRRVSYKTGGIDEYQSEYNVNEAFNFLNPKTGISYAFLDNNMLYASFSIAHREPNRSDYLNSSKKPIAEKLQNIEVGWRYKNGDRVAEINYYYMRYLNQLVLTGEFDNVGLPIRFNVGKSYRTGVELSTQLPIIKKLIWNPNATFSINRNQDFLVVDNLEPVKKNTSIILSPQIIASSQFDYYAFKNFQISLLSKYVGKQFLNNSQQDNLSIPKYFVSNIILSYSLYPQRIKQIEMSLLVNNLLDTKYVSNGYVYGGSPYLFPQAGINFLFKLMVKL